MAALGRFWGQSQSRGKERMMLAPSGEMAVLGGHVRYVLDSSKERELFDRADAILLQRHELLSVDAEQNPSGFVSNNTRQPSCNQSSQTDDGAVL